MYLFKRVMQLNSRERECLQQKGASAKNEIQTNEKKTENLFESQATLEIKNSYPDSRTCGVCGVVSST